MTAKKAPKANTPKATTAEDVANTTTPGTQEVSEAVEVVSAMTVDEVFEQAAANPVKGEEVPKRGPAMASGTNTLTEAQKAEATQAAGKTSAEAKAAADAVRARAKAASVGNETPTGETETPEQRIKLAKAQQKIAHKENAARKVGEGSLATSDVLEERLESALANLQALADSNTPSDRRELRRMAELYGNNAAKPFSQPDKMPIETDEKYHKRNAMLKRKHIRDQADLAYLSAKAQALLRQVKG
jgi:hypothetical protein